MGEQLQCWEEYGNTHDMYAISVIHKDSEAHFDKATIGHLPQNISTPCHVFLRSGSTIVSVVNGARYSREQNKVNVA